MKSDNPLQIFLNSHWENLDDKSKEKYSLISDFILLNNDIVDVAIVQKNNPNEIFALGKYYNEIIKPTENEIRYYFHNGGLIGCGTSSNIWFYFDKNSIIANELKYDYPYDELIKDINDLLQRMTIN